MARRDRTAEIEEQAARAAEVDEVRPYLDLAQEIRAAVDRFTADDSAEPAGLLAAIDSIAVRERRQVANTVFDRLSPEQQWGVIERVFGDDELRDYLGTQHDATLAAARRGAAHDVVASAARGNQRLDLLALADGVVVTLGLFRSEDVRAAIDRGHLSQVCARQLVLRATGEPGVQRVVSDTFNPRRGLFVTGAYDEAVWRRESLASHTTVRVGSVVERDAMLSLEPCVYPQARVDIEVDGELRQGSLFLGFAMIGDTDVFAARS